MPFCPKCAFEYSSEVMACPDCAVALVEHLPVKGTTVAISPDDSWVRVCTVGDGLTSKMICGLLDSNNIPSMIMASAFYQPDGKPGPIMPPDMPPSENEVVMVPREFRQDAELLLLAILGDEPERPNAPKR